MNLLKRSFETFETLDDEIQSIYRHASVSIGDESVRSDVSNRFQCIDRQLSTEDVRDFKGRLQDALAVVKESVQSTWKNAKKVTDDIAIAFDGTESKHLESVERKLANARGDLPGSASLNDRKIADMLHVNGRVPNDPKATLTPLITLVKKMRTEAIPNIHKSLVETGTALMNLKPLHSPSEYHDVVMRVVNDANELEDLLSYFQPEELSRQFAGGASLVRPMAKPINVDYAKRIGTEEADTLLRKIDLINKVGLRLIRNPSEKCPEATSSRIPLLNSQSASATLKLVRDLIDEGKFLAGYRPNDGGGFYPARTIGWALGEITKFAQPVGIDAADKATAHLCADYYESGIMQYNLLPSSVCRMAFDTANAYIRLVEESIKQYR